MMRTCSRRIERQAEGLAEGDQSPLGGIGLGGLEGKIVGFAEMAAAAFSGAASVAHDRRGQRQWQNETSVWRVTPSSPTPWVSSK